MTEAALSLQTSGIALLYASALLACASAYQYSRAVWPFFNSASPAAAPVPRSAHGHAHADAHPKED